MSWIFSLLIVALLLFRYIFGSSFLLNAATLLIALIWAIYDMCTGKALLGLLILLCAFYVVGKSKEEA